ncbi:hypothetical protein BDR26DRAFT_941611 [Obelidium mucronatum]|nr:hypothetical protein BDR26DRAFT_941611 [Obelidium mucronatum]
MLSARGYTGVPDPDSPGSPSFQEVMCQGKPVCDESVRLKVVEKLVLQMDLETCDHALLIYTHQLTPSAKRFLENQRPKVIESFAEQELVFNIMRHKSMPEISVLSGPEKDQLLRT